MTFGITRINSSQKQRYVRTSWETRFKDPVRDKYGTPGRAINFFYIFLRSSSDNNDY